MTKKEHKYAKVLRWIADGEKVQIKVRGTADFSNASADRVLIEIADRVLSPECFRLAPRTIRVNGVEVPAPESMAPEDGVDYYFPTPHGVDIASSDFWEGCKFDLRLLNRGLVYLNKEDAIDRAKAMLLTQE